MIVEITGTFHNHIHFNKRIELKLICINIAMQLYDQRIYDWQMANVFSKWFSQYMFSGAKVIGSFRGKAFSPKFRFLVFLNIYLHKPIGLFLVLYCCQRIIVASIITEKWRFCVVLVKRIISTWSHPWLHQEICYVRLGYDYVIKNRMKVFKYL